VARDDGPSETGGGPAEVSAAGGAAPSADRAGAARIVPFGPELLPAVRGFCERYWSRPRSAAYYEWRYLRPQPFGRMFLAAHEGECLGMLYALLKRYRVGGQPTACLEVFDWHSLPELRGSGLGIRLMRAMMRQPEPVISVGGTADVMGTLPLMGWGRIGVARRYELPVSADLLAARLQRLLRLPAALSRSGLGALSAAYYLPRRRQAPAGGRVAAAGPPGEEVQRLYEGETGYGLLQEPDPRLHQWLNEGEWSGRYRYLAFHLDGRLRGWAMTRTFLTERGPESAIVELFAPRPELALYTWMVSETALSLLPERPRRLHARASCALLQAALQANHFRTVTPEDPVHVWPKELAARAAPPQITFEHSDGPIMPYEPETRATARPPS